MYFDASALQFLCDLVSIAEIAFYAFCFWIHLLTEPPPAASSSVARSIQGPEATAMNVKARAAARKGSALTEWPLPAVCGRRWTNGGKSKEINFWPQKSIPQKSSFASPLQIKLLYQFLIRALCTKYHSVQKYKSQFDCAAFRQTLFATKFYQLYFSLVSSMVSITGNGFYLPVGAIFDKQSP